MSLSSFLFIQRKKKKQIKSPSVSAQIFPTSIFSLERKIFGRKKLFLSDLRYFSNTFFRISLNSIYDFSRMRKHFVLFSFPFLLLSSMLIFYQTTVFRNQLNEENDYTGGPIVPFMKRSVRFIKSEVAPAGKLLKNHSYGAQMTEYRNKTF